MLPKISHLFRLVKEPDLRYGASGTAVCKLYLVASEKYKEKETALWLGATAFGKTAEFIANVQKGQRVFCTGKLQTDEWTDQQGQKQSRITMLIDSFDYVEKASQQPSQNQAQQVPQQNSASHGGMIDDDIPFLQHEKYLLI